MSNCNVIKQRFRSCINSLFKKKKDISHVFMNMFTKINTRKRGIPEQFVLQYDYNVLQWSSEILLPCTSMAIGQNGMS